MSECFWCDGTGKSKRAEGPRIKTVDCPMCHGTGAGKKGPDKDAELARLRDENERLRRELQRDPTKFTSTSALLDASDRIARESTRALIAETALARAVALLEEARDQIWSPHSPTLKKIDAFLKEQRDG